MIIKTKRLLLRNLRIEDARYIKRNISKEVIKWLPEIPWPYTFSDAKEYIKNSLFNFKNKTSYDFCILFNDKLIGTISLSEVNFKHKRARLSYLLNRNYWGKGIMTEAVLAILFFCFNKLKLQKIYTGVIQENLRSLRLLKKLKFKKEGINRRHFLINNKFYDEIILGLLKDEFQEHN